MARIKSLTLVNFKSFKQATIPIAEGFTVIVGPNGSGKSNIIDALLFVMGESRLKLVRAQRLKDLVRIGASEADVVVEVEGDGKSYTVSRSIDREGRSVYRINGKRVTKGEVVALLSSLGFSPGTHNAVLQGEITRFIKMGPVERRRVIEEIAGIQEFEEKKKEALEKLEKVQQRIREVSVLLEERLERLKELERERERALRWMELKRKIRGLRRYLLERERREAEERIKKYSEERGEIERELREIEEELEKLNEEERRVREELVKVMEELGIASSSEIGKIEREISGLEERKALLLRSLEDMRKRLERVEERLEEVEEEIRGLERNLREVEEKIGIFTEERERRLEEIKKVESFLKEIEEDESRLLSLESELERLRKEYEKLSVERASLESRYNVLREEWERRKKREMEAVRETEELERRKKELVERERFLSQELIRIEERIKELREIVGETRGIRRALKSMGISVDALEELMAAQKRGELRGIHGFLASLISFDRKYTRAIEAAAGRRLFYVVTETDMDAAEAIKYLKRNELGRLTFIPLNRVRVPSLRFHSYPGLIGRASDLVSYDPKYRRAVEYALGDSLVFDNIDNARKVEDARAVTLEGDVVERSGVMSGGSSRGESILALFKVAERGQELRELERERDDINRELSRIRRELASIDTKLSVLRKETGVEKREEMEELERRIGEIEEKMRKIADAISEKEMEKARILSKMKKKEIEEYTRLRRELESIERDLERLKAHRESVLERLAEKRRLLSELREEKEELEERIRETEEEVEGVENRLEELLQKKRELEKELKEAEEELSRKKEALEERLEDIERRIGEIGRRKTLLEKRLTRIEVEVSGLLQKVGELEEDLRDLTEEPVEGDWETLSRWEEEMRSLEPVNMRAVEEYEELKEKVGEVKEKVDKLKEERSAVLDMIKEIEKRKREVFMEVYNGIVSTFREVYRELTGGSVKVRLEGEDPFKGGLIIEAIPPGKKLRSMDALSGGEKAMVALAFIFATALFRPSPFYVLDEPDLMLDKVNAERMARYIKKLSKRAQFIVVSHRDVVIKEADQVIGVYMKEGGSSFIEIRTPARSVSAAS